MWEPGREDYKIQSFDAETQQLLKTAFKDPGAVDLEKVADVTVDRSLQDCVFSKEVERGSGREQASRSEASGGD